MIDFEEVKTRANRISDALGAEDFQEVWDFNVDIRELSPADIYAVTRLSDIYSCIKQGSMSRDEAIRMQKEIKEEWRKERL